METLRPGLPDTLIPVEYLDLWFRLSVWFPLAGWSVVFVLLDLSQEDVVMGTLTVRENLHFSAALRLPSSVPQSEKEARVNHLIKELGLTKVAHSKVRLHGSISCGLAPFEVVLLKGRWRSVPFITTILSTRNELSE